MIAPGEDDAPGRTIAAGDRHPGPGQPHFRRRGQHVAVGPIELPQVGAAVPMGIEGAVRFQATDDVKAQFADCLAELGGSEPGVHQKIEGLDPLGQGLGQHFQGQLYLGQFGRDPQVPGHISPGSAGLSLPGPRRRVLGEMEAEIEGEKIPDRQQRQGQEFVTLNGLAPAVTVHPGQVFQALAPFGQDGGVQDQAVILGALKPPGAPPQKADKAAVERSPTPFGLLEAVERIFVGLRK